jgi:hypothetical protein
VQLFDQVTAQELSVPEWIAGEDERS